MHMPNRYRCKARSVYNSPRALRFSMSDRVIYPRLLIFLIMEGRNLIADPMFAVTCISLIEKYLLLESFGPHLSLSLSSAASYWTALTRAVRPAWHGLNSCSFIMHDLPIT